MEAALLGLRQRASLSSALLTRNTQLVDGALSPLAELSMPLFFRKGEASAAQFRPRDNDPHVIISSSSAIAAYGAMGLRRNARNPDRLWMRVSPERREELRSAAARMDQSCQAFLVEALDAFMARTSGVPTFDFTSNATPLVPSLGKRRVKLSVRLDQRRICAARRAAAEADTTLQNLLSQALDEHLRDAVRH